MAPPTSNFTGKLSKLLQPGVASLNIRRIHDGQGIDAQISMMPEKVGEPSTTESEHTHSQKRKRGLEEEKEVDELADRIKKIRCDEVLPKSVWELLDEVVWPKRGLLYGPWNFDS